MEFSQEGLELKYIRPYFRIESTLLSRERGARAVRFGTSGACFPAAPHLCIIYMQEAVRTSNSSTAYLPRYVYLATTQRRGSRRRSG